MNIISDEILIAEITDGRNTLSTDRLDMSYGELINLYQRGDLVITPSFQRLFRWGIDRRSKFIESILLGIPIPPIFVAEDTDGKWELVDGLQRISTIISFFGKLQDNSKNKWVLEQGDLIPTMEGYNIDTLPKKYIRNIERTYCRVEIIKWDSNYDMRYELFSRLNTGGESLTQQEIRNCIFRGTTEKFNDLLKELANNSIFLDTLNLSTYQVEQLYNEELVLRFFSLYYGDWSQGKAKNMSLFMTEFMKTVVSDETFNYTDAKKVFLDTLEIIKVTNENHYKFSNHQFSTSLFDAIFVGIAKNIEIYNPLDQELLIKNIENLKKDDMFRKYTGSAASSKSRILNRMKEAFRIMSNNVK